MRLGDDCLYRKTVAVLATMHRKERVTAPVLKEGLGLMMRLAEGVDTGTFSTFSRDVERTGSQLDTARARSQQLSSTLPKLALALPAKAALARILLSPSSPSAGNWSC
jgi:hypothetical protein